MTLPRFVVVKSNHNKKYLRYLKQEDGEEDAPAGFLKFTGEEARSHYAKYEVEMAKSTENKGFVHIRCCYNNKYWVRVNGTDKFEGDVLIVAGADEPEEDQSKPSRTLFEPVYVDPIDDEDDDNKPDDKAEDDLEEDSQVVQFRHVQLGRYTCLHNDSDALVLFGGSNSATDDPNNLESRDVCTVVNWESLDERIWADAFNPTAGDKNYKDTLHKAIKLYDKTIALINVGNNNYCKRYASGICALSANVPNLSIYSHLKVEEPVKSRTMPGPTITKLTSKSPPQRPSTSPKKPPLIYSMKLKTTIEAPAIPRIATHEGGLNKVEISDGFKGDVPWVETEAYQTEVETVCVVDVPAKSVLKVRLLATTASCDVPFSYSRQDTRSNGQVHVRLGRWFLQWYQCLQLQVQ
ncbi:unnamed protein product [Prunus armeniaca]